MSLKKKVKSPPGQRLFYLLDASKEPLGRLAVKVVNLLTGKHLVSYQPHLDEGGGVLVINAATLVTTGKKEEKKRYFRYSGYPSGLKSETLRQLKNRRPEEVIRHAVRGMLPKNKLLKRRLARLWVYPKSDYPRSFKVVNYDQS